MSDLMEPRSAAVRDIPLWLRESRALMLRRPGLFAAVSVSYHFLAASTRSLGGISLLVSLLLCQVAVSMLVLAAERADLGHAMSMKAMYALLHRILWCLILLTVIFAAIYLAGAFVVLMLDLHLPGGSHGSTASLHLQAWLMPGNTAFLVLYMGICVSMLWFLIPLITLNPLGLREALLLAWRAEGRNERVVFLVSYAPCVGLVVAGLLSQWTLILGLLVVPLFATLQYVAYRHVFLGRRANHPMLVSGLEAVPTSAAR